MEGQIKKGFFEKPENITSSVIILIVIALVVMFFGSIAPLMALALQGGLYTLAFAAVVGLLLFAITNKEWRIALYAFYVVFIRKITSFAVEMDPIAIIRNHLRNLMRNIEDMSGSIDTVAGENKKIKNKIRKNSETMEGLKQSAIIARNKMMQEQEGTVRWIEFKSKATLDSNQVGRLAGSNEKLNEMLQRGLNLENILERQLAAARFVHADMTAKVDLQEDEWKTTQAGYSAYESARKVLAGDEDSQSLYLQSMEYMADEMGRKVGEIERFTKNTSHILTGMDIDNEVFTNKGMKMIDEWSSKGQDLFITEVKVDLPGAVQLPKLTAKPDVVVSKSKYR